MEVTRPLDLQLALACALIIAGLVWAISRTVSSAGGGYGTIFLVLGLLALLGIVGTAAVAVGLFRRENGALMLLGFALATALVLLIFGAAVGLRG